MLSCDIYVFISQHRKQTEFVYTSVFQWVCQYVSGTRWCIMKHTPLLIAQAQQVCSYSWLNLQTAELANTGKTQLHENELEKQSSLHGFVWAHALTTAAAYIFFCLHVFQKGKKPANWQANLLAS